MSLPASRSTTYAPATPIQSADLNALQDIAVDYSARSPVFIGAADIEHCPDAVAFDPHIGAFIFASKSLGSNKLRYMWGNWTDELDLAPSPIGTVGAAGGPHDIARIVPNGLGTVLILRNIDAPALGATIRINRTVDYYTVADATTVDDGNGMPQAIWNVDRWIGMLGFNSGASTWYSSPDASSGSWTPIAHPGMGSYPDVLPHIPWAEGASGRLVVLNGRSTGGANVGAYTDNRGVSWTPIPSAVNFADRLVYLPMQKCFVASHTDYGFLAMSRSFDNGATWTAFSGTLKGFPAGNGLAYQPELRHLTRLGPGTLVGEIAVDTAVTGGGISATDAFLVMSRDAGTTWHVAAKQRGGACDEIATGAGAIVVRNATTEKAYWYQT